MARLTFAQLEGYWIAAGGDPGRAPLMAAIAEAESSGDPGATNPTDNGGRQTSWGLWQISNGDHSQPDPQWDNPLVNARLAVAKLKEQGLGAWGTWTSGAYKDYLQDGVAPVAPTGGGGGGGGSAGAGGVSQADLTSALGGWLGGFLTTAEPSPITGLAGVLGTVGTPIANTLTDFDHALQNAMHGLLWLVNPMNWVRIIAGIVGGAAAITGAILLYQAA
jgi:hypothetical protein